MATRYVHEIIMYGSEYKISLRLINNVSTTYTSVSQVSTALSNAGYTSYNWKICGGYKIQNSKPWYLIGITSSYINCCYYSNDTYTTTYYWTSNITTVLDTRHTIRI